MAKKKIDLKSAFLTDDVISNEMIEKAVYQNLHRINDKKTVEIHSKLMNMIDAKSSDDCMYFEYDEFIQLIQETRYKKVNKESQNSINM